MRVHILAVTADMSQADILQALRTFSVQQTAEAPAESLPAPAPPKPLGENSGRTRQIQPAKTGLATLVRRALQESPKTSAQLRDWLRKDHPALTRSVSQAIWSLIKQHQVQRDPGNGLCRLISD